MHGPDEAPLRVVVLLQQDAAEGVVARAVVPLHAEQPAAAVVVVEQRGSKPLLFRYTGSDQGPSMDGAVTR